MSAYAIPGLVSSKRRISTPNSKTVIHNSSSSSSSLTPSSISSMTTTRSQPSLTDWLRTTYEQPPMLTSCTSSSSSSSSSSSNSTFPSSTLLLRRSSSTSSGANTYIAEHEGENNNDDEKIDDDKNEIQQQSTAEFIDFFVFGSTPRSKALSSPSSSSSSSSSSSAWVVPTTPSAKEDKGGRQRQQHQPEVKGGRRHNVVLKVTKAWIDTHRLMLSLSTPSYNQASSSSSLSPPSLSSSISWPASPFLSTSSQYHAPPSTSPSSSPSIFVEGIRNSNLGIGTKRKALRRPPHHPITSLRRHNTWCSPPRTARRPATTLTTFPSHDVKQQQTDNRDHAKLDEDEGEDDLAEAEEGGNSNKKGDVLPQSPPSSPSPSLTGASSAQEKAIQFELSVRRRRVFHSSHVAPSLATTSVGYGRSSCDTAGTVYSSYVGWDGQNQQKHGGSCGDDEMDDECTIIVRSLSDIVKLREELIEELSYRQLENDDKDPTMEAVTAAATGVFDDDVSDHNINNTNDRGHEASVRGNVVIPPLPSLVDEQGASLWSSSSSCSRSSYPSSLWSSLSVFQIEMLLSDDHHYCRRMEMWFQHVLDVMDPKDSPSLTEFTKDSLWTIKCNQERQRNELLQFKQQRRRNGGGSPITNNNNGDGTGSGIIIRTGKKLDLIDEEGEEKIEKKHRREG